MQKILLKQIRTLRNIPDAYEITASNTHEQMKVFAKLYNPIGYSEGKYGMNGVVAVRNYEFRMTPDELEFMPFKNTTLPHTIYIVGRVPGLWMFM